MAFESSPYRHVQGVERKDQRALLDGWRAEQAVTPEETSLEKWQPVALFALTLLKSISRQPRARGVDSLRFVMKRAHMGIECPSLTLTERARWYMVQYLVAALAESRPAASTSESEAQKTFPRMSPRAHSCYTLVGDFLATQPVTTVTTPAPILELDTRLLKAVFMLLGARLRDDAFHEYVGETLTYWNVGLSAREPEGSGNASAEAKKPMTAAASDVSPLATRILASAPKILATVSSAVTPLGGLDVTAVPADLLKLHWLYENTTDYAKYSVRLLNVFACMVPYEQAHALLHVLDRETQASYRFVEFDETEALQLIRVTMATSGMTSSKASASAAYLAARERVCQALLDAKLRRQLCPQAAAAPPAPSAGASASPSATMSASASASASTEGKVTPSSSPKAYCEPWIKILELMRERYLTLRAVLLVDLAQYHQDAFRDLTVPSATKLQHLSSALDALYQGCRTLLILWFRAVSGRSTFTGKTPLLLDVPALVFLLDTHIQLYVALRDENIATIGVPVKFDRPLRSLLPVAIAEWWSKAADDPELQSRLPTMGNDREVTDLNIQLA